MESTNLEDSRPALQRITRSGTLLFSNCGACDGNGPELYWFLFLHLTRSSE